MLRYLAKDYLADALQHRRIQLERMMVTQPHHIEFVNQYVHKGNIQGEDSSPWNILEKIPDYHHLPYGSVSHTDASINSDLSTLVHGTALTVTENGGGKWIKSGVEDYQPFHDDGGVDESDALSLSQDIDAAMERLMPPSNDDLSSSGPCNEVFVPAELLSNNLQVDDGYGEGLLEDMEAPLHLEGLLELMPTVEDLAARLKPKMIHDPFLSTSGEPYTYAKLCWSDFLLADHKDDLQCKTSCSGEPYHETFQEDDLVRSVLERDVDPLMELVVVEMEVVLDGMTESEMPISLSSDCDTELDQSINQKAAASDFKDLVDGCNESGGLWRPEAPKFTPPDRVEPLEFVDLNNQGIENDSNDSGIGHALLESPCIPPPSSPLTSSTPLIQYQLSKLDPMPLTPESELFILSPIAKKKQLKDIWEKEKLFDTVLALTLPCPDISNTAGNLTVSATEDAISKLEIQPLKFDGYNEFELSWDPLEYSYKDMGIAGKSLVSCQPVFDLIPSEENGGEIWTEVFACDIYICEEMKRDDDGALPLSPIVMSVDGADADSKTTSDIPSLILEPAAPPGYFKPLPITCSSTSGVDPWSLVQQAGSGPSHTATAVTKSRKDIYNFAVSPRQTANKDGVTVCNMEGISPLDAFFMLRSGVPNEGGRRKRPRIPSETGNHHHERKDKRQAMECSGANDTMELEIIERKTTPLFQDVCLSDKYLSVLSEMEHLASSLKGQLEKSGLHVPIRGVWPRDISVDSLKFFLKQQQKSLEDSRNSDKAGNALTNCQLAACLYLTGSVMDILMHCSLGASLSRFSSLCEKYSSLLNDRIFPLKSALIQLESTDTELHPPHPKLLELARVVNRWKKVSRKSCREKAIVVVEREFSSLSGEILDYLQSVPGLESCVFSFTSDETSNELYKKAVEERFHHYDCLVVPTTSLTNHSNFPWERVSLVVEYEPLKKPLFDGLHPITTNDRGQCEVEGDKPGMSLLSERLHLQEYITLRTVLDLSTSNTSFSSLAGDGIAYTVVTSENLTSNSQLLQLLETRYNVLVVERNYKTLLPSKWLNWADLSISQGSGILLRPLSVLGSDASGRSLIHILMGLSLQYSTCWVILYQQDQESYELGGCVPYQLSLLHAAVAPLHAHYSVHILMASSLPHVAKLIRRIIEETHKEAKDNGEWDDRSWLSEVLNEKEKYLLLFPSIHSFSAQFMLQRFTLGGLLAADLSVLAESLPGMPEKALRLFYKMTHANMVPAMGCSSISPALPISANVAPLFEATHYIPEQTAVHLHSPISMVKGHHDDEEYYARYLSVNKPPFLELENHCITSCDSNGGANSANITGISETHRMFSEYIPHNRPTASSPIPGLNDSLEKIESCREPIIEHQSNTENMFAKNWTEIGEDFQFTSREQEARNVISTLSRSLQPRLKEHGSAFSIPYHPSESNVDTAGHQTSNFSFPGVPHNTSLSLMTTNEKDFRGYSGHTMSSDKPTSIYNSSLPVTSSYSNTTQFSSSESEHFLKPKTARQFSSSKKIDINPPKLSEKESSTSYGPVSSTSSPHPHASLFSTGLFDSDHLIPRSSRAIASSVVRKPISRSFVERVPVKALDLGLESEGRSRLRLESNDRTLVSSQMSRYQVPYKRDALPQVVRRNRMEFSGSEVRSKYFATPSSTPPSIASDMNIA